MDPLDRPEAVALRARGADSEFEITLLINLFDLMAKMSPEAIKLVRERCDCLLVQAGRYP